MGVWVWLMVVTRCLLKLKLNLRNKVSREVLSLIVAVKQKTKAVEMQHYLSLEISTAVSNTCTLPHMLCNEH